MHQNGTIWTDTDGHAIQAHGGMILHHLDTYYCYGENPARQLFGECTCHPLAKHPIFTGTQVKGGKRDK